MGKIDKEKLLKECKCLTDGYKFTYCMNQCKHYANGENFQDCITKTIKNFPEEPEIDFDVIWEDHQSYCNIGANDSCDIGSCVKCFCDFLKSKHLTAPKQFEIPVKKVWTLKPEFERYSRSVGHTPTTLIIDSSAPQNIEFYDYHEEPDYSKIPKGSIIEVRLIKTSSYQYGAFQGLNNATIQLHNSNTYLLEEIKSVRIVELAEEAK